MKHLFPFLLFASVVTVSAQAQSADTLYFNKKWVPVFDRASATYMRPRPLATGNLFHVKDYYISGVQQMDGFSTSEAADIRTGHFVYYDSLGRKTSEGEYADDKKTGTWVTYRPETQTILFREEFQAGRWDGIRQILYPDGTIRRSETYVAGKMKDGHCFAPDGKEVKYFPFEEMPVFKGDVSKFLSREVRYPEEDRLNAVSGRVIVRFVIDENGEISDPQVRQSVSPGLDAEALRVVRAMPAWKPAMQDGKPVKVYFNLPIKFALK